MRRPPVFADPKTDFIFQRVFTCRSEDHKTALLGFLNDILQLDEAHRITSVTLLPPEQRPKVSELKSSIVDVKCVDAAGITYVVEMQVFNVEADSRSGSCTNVLPRPTPTSSALASPTPSWTT